VIFASVFLYSGQKLHELLHPSVPWEQCLALWRQRPELCPWQGLHTIASARTLDRLVEYVGAGALITKGRSRAAGYFLQSDADVWLTVDEDVRAELATLERLIARARETRGIVSAPCVLRSDRSEGPQPAKLNVGLAPGLGRLGEDLAELVRTGMGLVAIHRQAILDVAARAPLVHAEGGAPEYPALFLEEVRDGVWIGEDFAFSDRALAAGVPMHALLDAPTVHARVRGMLRRDLSVVVGWESADAFARE